MSARIQNLRFGFLGIVLLSAAIAAVAGWEAPEARGDLQEPSSTKVNRFLGASKCKLCHGLEATGNAHGKWLASKHSHAFKDLATPAAKKLAVEQGVADAQTNPKCLKCHVTAFGEPAERLSKSYQLAEGVQCESCHGPGERHFKNRLAGTPESDEIIRRPTVASCIACHNAESPTFAGFCFKKAVVEILHLNPQKKTSESLLADLACTCGETCKCQSGECGGWPGEAKPKKPSGAGD